MGKKGMEKLPFLQAIYLQCMGADYLIDLISIETYAPQFIGHIKIFLGSVHGDQSLEISNRLL